MSTLTITKMYAAQTPLMEVDLDSYRNGLLTLFNTDKFDSGNFAGNTALTHSHFTGVSLLAADNTDIDFGATQDASFGLDSSKNLLLTTANSSFEIRLYAGTTFYLEILSTHINVPGDIILNSNDSNGSKGVLQNLAMYRKPVLEWSSSTEVSLQNNTSTADNTTIYFPNLVASVTESSPTKYRKAAISATANGYASGHSGAVIGGRRSGVSATTNSWFYTYAVKVQSGNEYSATAAKFVIVFDTTAPLTANAATLDGYYGAGNYVYLGVIRYGFGATGDNNDIPKFKYSNKGWCTFYEASSSGYGGLNLAYTTTDGDNTSSALYTIAAGTSGNVIPETIGRCRFNVTRQRGSDWKVRETSSSSSDVIWAGGFQTYDATIPHGFLLELPNVVGYSFFQERKSSNAGTARGVVLAGFIDGYMLHRRSGHGI
jgi:hypothetical protein